MINILKMSQKFIEIGKQKLKERGSEQLSATEVKIDKTKVFIVHGHDKLAFSRNGFIYTSTGIRTYCDSGSIKPRYDYYRED